MANHYRREQVAGMSLSPRDKDIVRMVADGKSNKQIADELGLTYGSVRQYMYWIFAKVGAPNRAALAVYAYRNGLVQ